MSDSSEQRLQAILHEYLQAIDRGERPDRQALLDAHPDLCEELAEYFADASKLERMAKSLKTLSLVGSAIEAPSLGVVRYFGDYELIAEIARGGMGVVYRANQVSLRREVALKMILKGELASEVDVRRFRQEAEAAAKLDHPNIVPIYEVGDHEGQQYFSMKLIAVAAKSAHFGVGREGQRHVAETLAKVARAVHHAHQRGILHRDLKPSNILIDRDGEPHVADFGLAKKVEGGDDATKSGAIIGTPAYMAPEQARAEKQLTTAVDVYSLGAILYEWLAGRPPFRGEDALSTLLKVATEEPPPLRGIDAKIDRDLETICLRCLEKEPPKRYGSAEALAVDLERWLGGEPIEARPASFAERTMKWARRRPAAAALVVVCLAAAAVLAASSVVSYRALEEKVRVERQAADERQQALAAMQAEQARTATALEGEQRVAYANRLALAHAEWRSNNVVSANQLLDGAPKERRGWEWRYLDRLFHPDLEEHYLAGMFRVLSSGSVAYSPDGMVLAAGGNDCPGPEAETKNENWPSVIRLWKADDGTPLEPIRGLDVPPSTLVFSKNGARLAGAYCGVWQETEPVAAVWDIRSRREIYRVVKKKIGPGIGGIAMSPDGRLLAVAEFSAARIEIHDIDAAREIAKVDGVLGPIVFSPDGKTIAAASEAGEVLLLDAHTGKRLRRVAEPTTGRIVQIAFSPDGKRLAASRDPYEAVSLVEVRNVVDGSPVSVFAGHTDYVLSLAFSPDGKTCATGDGGGIVRIWDSATGRERFSIPLGRRVPALALAFHPDGRRLAGIVPDGRGDVVKVWDASWNREYRKLDAPILLGMPFALSSDGQRLAALTLIESGVHAWNVADARALAFPKPKLDRGVSLTRVAFRPDGELRGLAMTSDLQFEVWNLSSGKKLCTIARQKRSPSCNGEEDGQEISPDGAYVLLGDGDDDHTVKVFDATTGAFLVAMEELKYKRPLDLNRSGEGLMHRAEFAAGNRYVVVRLNNWDAKPDPERAGMRVFDRATGRQLWFRKGWLQDIVLSGDGRFVASSIDGKRIVVWEIANGKQVCEFDDAGQPTAFTDDGKRLATTTAIWNIDGTRLCRLSPPTAPVAVFEPGGQRLAAVLEGTVALWNVETGQRTYVLRGFHDEVSNLRFTPDGNRLITLSRLANGGEIRSWDATPRAGRCRR